MAKRIASIFSDEQGFTFIEVMVSVLILSIAAIGLLQGVVFAKNLMRSVRIEKQALAQLENYVEEYRGIITEYGRGIPWYIATPRQPKRVTLLEDEDDESKSIYGEIDRDLVRVIDSGLRAHPYYRLKAWIEWDEYPNDDINATRRLDVEVSFIQY